MFLKAKKYWVNEFAHDRLLWTWAMLNHSLYLYNASVITFRRHDSNATGFSKLNTSKTERKSVSLNNAHVVRRMLNELSQNLNTQEYRIIEKYIEYELLRARLVETGNVFLWLKLLVSYNKYMFSFKSALKDLLIAIKRK